MDPATMEPVKDELKALVKGTDQRIVIKDKAGKDHVLSPLDLSDLVDLEDKMQESFLNVEFGKNLRLGQIMFMIYLSLRKEGLSHDDLKRRAFKYTEREVYMMFDLGMMAKAAGVFVDLLKVSGLDVGPLVPSPTK